MKEVYFEMNPSEIEDKYLNGIYNEIAELLGVEVAMKLHSTYRGQQVTFPVNFFSAEFIAIRVAREYDGHNVKQLATKYGYSEKWIRKMIKEQRKK